MTQARTYPAGVTSWIDVDVDDVEAAQQFYGSLFGWTFSTATPPDAPVRYVVAQLDGHDVAGIGGPARPLAASPADPASGGRTASWSTYVAVDDADATCAAVEATGGRVVTPPADAGEGGRAATCADPTGVGFRLWQARRRLGAQVTNAPGAWNFSDLHTVDPRASSAFYEQVFGWVFADLGFATMIQVPGYGDHLAATTDPGIHERQAAAGAPPGFADVIGGLAAVSDGEEPGWRVTFTVADRDEAASLVESLGGRVVRREETGWTRTALVADPQGATFTLSQLTPPG